MRRYGGALAENRFARKKTVIPGTERSKEGQNPCALGGVPGFRAPLRGAPE